MDNASSAAGPALIVIMLVWLLVAVGILVWYLWAMARLFPRIGLKSSDGWIPIWNQWKLLERVGLPGWIVLLSFVGLGIVPTIMLIMAMHRLGKEYGAGAGYTVLGVFLPPLWATLFANLVGSPNVHGPTRSHTSFAQAAPVVSSPFAVNPQPGFGAPPLPAEFSSPSAPPAVPAPPAPPAAAGQFAQFAAAPAPYGAPAASQPPATQRGFAAGQQPWAAGAVAGAVAPQFAPPLGGETEAEYDRLAAEAFRAPPAAPLGQNQAPAAFSWTAARAAQEPAEPLVLPEAVIPPVHPLAAASSATPAPPAIPAASPAPLAPPTPAVAPAVAPAISAPPLPPEAPITSAVAPASQGFAPAPPSADSVYATREPVLAQPTPAPSVQKATGITGMLDPLPAPALAGAAHAAGTAQDEALVDFDNTVVVPRRNRSAWVLELPDGSELSLEDDVVVGRKPEPINGSATLTVPDSTRTLSKSHVRLMRDSERWVVEDLGSTNGLVLLNEDGTESELSPGVRAEATERMLFGTLEVRLRLGGDSA